MFTGIIEHLGEIRNMEKEGENIHFTVASPLSNELKIDQSLSHDGTCLTVVDKGEDWHKVTAILETLRKTCLGQWEIGYEVNLERSMSANGRFDGHIVQGHVDTVAVCKSVKEEDGSWFYTFQYDPQPGHITVEKGSICVNGVSLTVVDSQESQFSVAIIPYTFEHTNFHNIQPSTQVNLEFDILGKYIQKMMKSQG